MSIDLRLPNIHGSDREQLVQMRSYLYQLVGELQWALNNVTPTSESVVIQTKGGTVLPSASSSTEIETTFGALKPLIIKSADIVKAYYEEINDLLKVEGSYVAESDFGKFVQNTKNTVSANSTNITNAYTNLQTIETDLIDASGRINTVDDEWKAATDTIKDNIETTSKTLSGEIGSAKDELSKSITDNRTALDGAIGDLDKKVKLVIDTTAYIKSGLLYEDKDENGNPISIYGLEIGQKDEASGLIKQRFARFTADRLSFYDSGGYEVAYISNKKLYIPNAEITVSAKLGGFMLDLSDGLRLKWEGR